MKKLLALVLVAGLAGSGVFYYVQASSANSPTFRTLPVTRGDLLISVSATGSVEPLEIIDVGAQIVGSVTGFGPDPDDPKKTIDYRSRVKEKGVLARLDDQPHQAELKKAQAAQKLAQAELGRCKAKLDQSKLDFARAEKLRTTNSESDYETATANLKIAQAEFDIAKAKLEQAEIVTKQAEINLSYTIIRSPVDGVVIDRRVNVGQTVVAGLNAPSLFLLARDLRQMLVWSAVNEADIGDIHVGQPVTFTVDAYRDRTFTGKVSQIRLNASMMQNVVTYGVVVKVENPDEKLLPYMTAKLQFEVARRPGAVLVPNQALRWRPTWDQVSPVARERIETPTADAGSSQDSDGANEEDQKVNPGFPCVWVVADDGFVAPIKIQTGLSDGVVTEIVGGDLKPGNTVAINVVREAKPDFVSSFISKVTKTKK